MLTKSYVGFCTNAFALESLASCASLFKNFRELFLANGAPPPNYQWALDLQLGSQLLKEIEDPQQARQLVKLLKKQGLKVGSLNVFPLCPFQQKVVKTKVYFPHWLEAERAQKTLQAAGWVAHHLKPAHPFPISTLAGRYHGLSKPSAKDFKDLAKQFSTFAEHLAKLYDQTGTLILLALEPEPLTTLQKTQDVQRLWSEFKTAAALRHLSINLDCCHFSVMGEDPLEAYQSMNSQGIPISKVHASTALDLKVNQMDSTQKMLEDLHEPRFLHQTIFFDQNGSKQIFIDLPEALENFNASVRRVTCHFHLPLFLQKETSKEHTSCQDTQKLLNFLRQNKNPIHIYTETYTWSVLGQKYAAGPLEGITKELGWLKRTLTTS